MFNKILTIIFILLVVVCGASIYIHSSGLAISTNNTKLEDSVIPVKTEIQTSATPLDPHLREDDNEKFKTTNQPATNRDPISQTDNLTVQQSNSLITPEESLSIKMIVGDKTYETHIAPDKTVYDLMQKLATTQDLQFSAKDYPALGKYVEEISGMKENKQKGIYWLLFVNGQSASVGISNRIIQSNDIISWKYDKAQF